jgi:hypothetical protein
LGARDLLGLERSRQGRQGPVRRRGDGRQQWLHGVPAGATPAQVGAQRGVDGGGVAGRVAQLQLFGDEAAHVLGSQFFQRQRPTGELVQQ